MVMEGTLVIAEVKCGPSSSSSSPPTIPQLLFRLFPSFNTEPRTKPSIGIVSKVMRPSNFRAPVTK